MIINPYRFAAAGTDVTTPIHWWDLSGLGKSAGQGAYDQGTKRDTTWDLDSGGGAIALVEGGPNGQDVIDMAATGRMIPSTISQAWDGDNTDQWSFACWAKADAIATFGNWLVSWRNISNADSIGQLLILNSATDIAYGGAWDSTDATLAADASTTAASATTWYHFVVTADYTGNMKVYQDAVEVDSKDISSLGTITTGAQDFMIGAASFAPTNAALGHDGKMFGVGVWDVALSPAEVQTLFDEVDTGGDGYYSDYTFV